MNTSPVSGLPIYIFTTIILIGSLVLVPGSNAGSPAIKIDISQNWQFRRLGSAEWRPASVPGSVHTDLLASGQIEDPFYRDNEHGLQWIEPADWEYRTSFDAGPEVLGKQQIEICFDGLDTYAEVYLNGVKLITADNMFCRWTADCKHILKQTGNLLRVVLFSPVQRVQAAWDSLGDELAGGPKVLTRKAGYHYGWDWGPRLVSSGIWRPAYLSAWDGEVISDIRIITESVTEERADLTAVIEIESSTADSAFIWLACLSDTIVLSRTYTTLQPGLNHTCLPFEIESPKLWWTNGLGAPFLYEFSGAVEIDGKTVSQQSGRFGIRTLELVTDHDEKGESFYFKLNGVPVFMKGANYIPQDCFIPRVSPGQYRNLIRDVVAANMNMLRVWGGGIYENDIFYDLCDENGILVWQDFMFACALYPGDQGFLDNVGREAVQNIRRLRNHPCLALWCGNNEIDEAWFNWGWQHQYGYSPADSTRIRNDYERLFHRLLPGIVAEHDGARPYWPSSPKFGRGDERSLYEGDFHYWGVWHDAEPFEMFKQKTGRFMSEYGFQSFPAYRTIESFTRPEDRAIDSPVMLSHQKHPRGNQLIQTYMDRDYKTPRNFEQFVYVSQLLQAEGIKTAVESHRRARPYCMGSLYWQLNDCWPVASWSSRDYFGNWKALHYFVKKAYGEVLVSPTVDDDTLKVYVVSDRLEPAQGELSLRLLDFQGELLWQQDFSRPINPNSSEIWFEIDLEPLLAGWDKHRVVLTAAVRYGQVGLSKNLLYFVPPRELDLPPAAVQKKIRKVTIGYLIELWSDGLVKNVHLSGAGLTGRFSDNYFDLLPDEKVRVFYEIGQPIDNFEQILRINTLLDSFDPDN